MFWINTSDTGKLCRGQIWQKLEDLKALIFFFNLESYMFNSHACNDQIECID